jgi:hypothetical protein
MATRALNTTADVHRENGTDLMARGLGMLSLMLGAMEVTGARKIAAMLGIRGQERLIMLCGAREILQGAAILAARDPTLWVWVRVAGDALDIGTLAAEHYAGNRSRTRSMAVALAGVLGISAMDVMNARRLSRENREPWSPAIDFSKRSGLPGRTARPRRGRARRPAASLQPAEAM